MLFVALWLAHTLVGARYLRAIVALWASQLYWVGIWNILTIQLSLQNSRTYELFPSTLWREVAFVGVGLVLLLVSDTLYGLAGVGGGVWPPWHVLNSRLVLFPRALVGLLGASLTFVGLYDIMDVYWFDRTALREWMYVRLVCVQSNFTS
jgi:hypothetical protein